MLLALTLIIIGACTIAFVVLAWEMDETRREVQGVRQELQMHDTASMARHGLTESLSRAKSKPEAERVVQHLHLNPHGPVR